MTENDWLAERFEEHRARLRTVAYRMLGSVSDSDDAVQEAWLRLSRTGGDRVDVRIAEAVTDRHHAGHVPGLEV